MQYTDVPEGIEPEEIRPMGNYAVSITWPDGFNQVIYMSDLKIQRKKMALNYIVLTYQLFSARRKVLTDRLIWEPKPLVLGSSIFVNVQQV